MDAVGAPHDNRVLMLQRPLRKDGSQGIDPGSQDVRGLHELEAQGVVLHVVGGQPEVDVPALRAEALGDGA
jgi:hypothetical protein